MATAINFSGLGSGLDTNSIVTALVNAKEQQLIDPLNDRVTAITAKRIAHAFVSARHGALLPEALGWDL